MRLTKYQLHQDVFSDALSAKSRSVDYGMGEVCHVQDVDGQAYYMPGESHEAYLEYYGETRLGAEARLSSEDALRILIREILDMKKMDIEGKILKADDEQRMVYGWASVVTEKGEPVVDRQGDVIEPDTLVKAVNEFMEHVRVGKTMHVGDQTGVIVHSMPMTKEIGESLGVHSDREGWIVAYKVYDDEVWNMVKSGELAAFSIGGRAIKEDYSA